MGGVPAILGVTAECHMSQLKAHTLKLLFPPLEDFFPGFNEFLHYESYT